MDDPLPPSRTGFIEFFRVVSRTIDAPVTWIRGNKFCM